MGADPLSLALIGATAASTAATAYGQVRAGRASSQAADYNAQIAQNNTQIAKQNATWAGQEGVQQASISEQKTRAGIGAITANQGASGVDIHSGSSAAVRASAKEVGALDAMTIRSNAARRAYGYETQGTSDTAQAQLDRFTAKNDTTAGNIGATSTVLGGAAKSYEAGTFSGYQSNNSVLNTSGTTDDYLSNVG